jgi:hypothetical protein
MNLDCYLIGDAQYKIRPASPRRQWMDDTRDAFAYRCMPLTIANSHGWEICCSHGFEAEWTGGAQPEDVVVYPDNGADIEVSGHFGSGILTFASNFVLRTERGYGLWVTGPPNQFKADIQPLSAVVESDWVPVSFTMNWKLFQPGRRIRFSKGEPYCFFFPIKLGLVEQFMPKMMSIDSSPEIKKQFAIAYGKRTLVDHMRRFRQTGKIQTSVEERSLRPMLSKGWYSKGQFPDGSAWTEHRSRVRVTPFEAVKTEEGGQREETP